MTRDDARAIDALKRALDAVAKPLASLSDDELTRLFCEGCDFWSPDKERLECGCFKILRQLVAQGLVTRDDLDALAVPGDDPHADTR